MEPPSQDPPAAAQQSLRAALIKLNEVVRPGTILKVARQFGSDDLFGPRALNLFLDGQTLSLKKHNYDPLAKAWLRSPLGRALRDLGAAPIPGFDQLVDKLAAGGSYVPAGMTVGGAYFMYHGSYIEHDHFVIRVIAIDARADGILTVTDSIRDDQAAESRLDRIATGVMTFNEEKPQILLWGDENKRGLSLIVGSRTDRRANALHQVTGRLIAMRQGGEAVSRYCLLLRQPGGAPEAMLQQSGIFPREEIERPHRQPHKQAFDLLARLIPAETIPDPMVTYRR